MKYSELTPYQLGETGDKEAIDYIIEYLINGSPNEKKLGASAINKLSRMYLDECNKAKPYLINNLNSEYPQLRQYTLKALFQLFISIEDIEKIREISESDDKQYNRDIANMILRKYKMPIYENYGTIQTISHSNKTKTILNNKNKIIDNNGNPSEEAVDIQIDDYRLNRRIFFKKFLDEIRKVVNTLFELFRFNDYGDKSALEDEANHDKLLANPNIIEFETEKESLSTQEISFGDAVSNIEFLNFLEYSNIIEYGFDESSDGLRKKMGAFRRLSNNIDFGQFKYEITGLTNQYRLFKISNWQMGQYFNLESEFSDLLKEEYELLADGFSNLFIEGINNIKINQRNVEILKSRYNFDGDKENSLRAIANKYGISAERVRQVVKKTNQRIRSEIRWNTNGELFKLKCLINQLIRPDEAKFEERFVLLSVYGFQPSNSQVFITLFTELILGKQYEDIVQNLYFNFTRRLNKKLEDERIAENQIKLFDKRIGSKILWFDNVRTLTEKDYNNILPVREVVFDNEALSGSFYSSKMGRLIQYESQLEKEVLSILEDSPRVIFYSVQPFKISYYYYKERNYIPDIFVVLDDRRGVVIEVKPKFYMALDLNLQKYYILKKFCKKNGYGILMTDGRISIEEIITHEVDKNFEKEMLEILTQRPIKWNEFSILKMKYSPGYKELSSIIIQNNLIFNRNPFIIARRTSNKGICN